MPTVPPRDLLDREWSRTKVAEAVKIAVPLLEEVVNYGTAAFARCLPALKDEEHHVAVLMRQRHALEMVDAVQLQIEAGATGPSRLQLRSAFEALLALEYMLKADTKRRAFAYLVGQTQREIGKHWTLRRKYADLGVPVEQIDHNLATFQRRLERPGWRETNEDLMRRAQKRFQKRRHFVPVEWFSFDGGPNSLPELAAGLGRGKEYDVLYREWSGIAHGSDLDDHVKRGPAQTMMVRRLRLPLQFETVVSFGVHFALDATKAILFFYRPGEELGFWEWYRREISGPLGRLG
jgi:hypothetical protein